MKPKPLIKNAGRPRGLFGKMMIRAMNKEHTPLSLWGLDKLPDKNYPSALDIGCGGGVNVLRLCDFCDRVCGVDLSELSVKEAKKRCKKVIRENRAEIGLASADALPYADGAFSLATAFETVYFWKDLEKCFAEVCRVLAEDGVFLIVNELREEEDAPEKYEKLHEIIDLTIYGGEELTMHLQNAGFPDVTVYSEGDWLCWVAKKGR